MGIYKFSIPIFVQQFLPSTKRTANHASWVRALLNPIQFLRDGLFNYYVDGYTDVELVTWSASVSYVVGDYVYYNGIAYECILNSLSFLPTNTTYFSVKAFSFQDIIKSADKGVYYCIKDNPTGIAPVNTEFWWQMQPNFIGLNERLKANAQILKYEYILNKWFGTNFNYPTSTNDVYITNTASDLDSFIYGIDDNDSSSHYSNDNEQEEYINFSYTTIATDFTINIPTATYDNLNPDEATGITATKDAIVRSFADKYNISGVNYAIAIY